MERKLIFFTKDIKESSYGLININQIDKKRKSVKIMEFIDPAVYSLKKNLDYPKIDLMYSLLDGNKLRDNQFISLDYPSDMNLDLEDEFIENTYKHNLTYYNHSNYISTPQFKFMDYTSFKYNFERTPKNEIIGMGNLCRIFQLGKGKSRSSQEKLRFVKNVFNYLNKQDFKWIHFYGIGMELAKIFIKLKTPIISIDNTKWTRYIDPALKKKFGVGCRNPNYQFFYWAWMYRLADECGNYRKCIW